MWRGETVEEENLQFQRYKFIDNNYHITFPRDGEGENWLVQMNQDENLKNRHKI